jgi:hypothetical protein
VCVADNHELPNQGTCRASHSKHKVAHYHRGKITELKNHLLFTKESSACTRLCSHASFACKRCSHPFHLRFKRDRSLPPAKQNPTDVWAASSFPSTGAPPLPNRELAGPQYRAHVAAWCAARSFLEGSWPRETVPIPDRKCGAEVEGNKNGTRIRGERERERGG